MGIYANTNATSARIFAIVGLITGFVLVDSAGRLSGYVLGLAGAILFVGAGKTLPHMGLRDIVLFAITAFLVVLAAGMYANGY